VVENQQPVATNENRPDGEMLERVRAFDWSATPLGPIEQWPQSLRVAVDICLKSRFPMFVWWGPELINIYNDAYAPMLGKRHPDALGRPASQTWADIWPDIEPQAVAVMQRGESTWNDRLPLSMVRNGYPEVAYFTFSYSPIFDEGQVRGLFCAVTEETARVRAEARDSLLLALDETIRPLTDPQEITAAGARLLGEHLDADRCAYADVEADEDTFNLTGDYNRGVPSIIGRYRFFDFGAEVLRLMRENKPYVVEDIDTHEPRVNDVAYYRQTRIQSVICVPLHKAGRFVAAMAVHQTVPRRWTPEEVDLVRRVAARCWESIERARVERTLRESEQRLQLAQNAAKLGTWELDFNTGEAIWSNGMWHLLDLTPRDERPMWDSWLTHIHPEDRESAKATFLQQVESGQAEFSLEFRILTARQRTRWLACKGRFVRDEAGRATRALGANVDITERKQAELSQRNLAERLAQHSRLFEQIATTTPDFIYVFDLAGRFLYANRRLLEVWGRTFEESVGKSLYELGYPQWHADMHMREIAEVIRTRQPIKGEVPFTGGSGISGVYEYIFTPELGPDGQVEVIGGTTRDVTDRKQAEDERRRLSAERDQQLRTFDTVLASLQEFVYLIDLDGRVTYANQPLLKLWGRSAADALGKTFAELEYPPDLVQLHTAQLAEVVRTKQPVRGEYAYSFAAGHKQEFEYIFVPLLAKDGSIEAIGGAARDVTEQRRQAAVREELLTSERAAREEAERASRMKDEFLATLSHELRTPLNAILGWSQILDGGTSTPEDLSEGLKSIERNARAQTQIIEDLLDMSSIISGKAGSTCNAWTLQRSSMPPSKRSGPPRRRNESGSH
jgi:PAS domain S-box-containing protein